MRANVVSALARWYQTWQPHDDDFRMLQDGHYIQLKFKVDVFTFLCMQEQM